jgi:phage shock protein C
VTNDIYTDDNTTTTTRKLRRSRDDRMVAGVCGGFAKLLGIDAAIVRILLVVATILGFGTGAVLYLACWLIMPEES